MGTLLKVIGVFVVATIMTAIPVLLGISFCLSWGVYIKILLGLLCFAVWFFICCAVADMCGKEE